MAAILTGIKDGVKSMFGAESSDSEDSQSDNENHKKTKDNQARDEKEETEANFNFDQVYTQIQELSGYIEQVKGKTIIPFLGPLGVGKSTTVNYLLGCKYTLGEGGSKATLEPQSQQVEQAKISHENTSETLFPAPYIAGEDVFYCDFPGLKDNRGDEARAFVSIATEAAIKSAKEIRSLALFVSPDMLTAERGTPFVENIRAFAQLFSDSTIFSRSGYLVITKASGWSFEEIVSKIQGIKIFVEKLPSSESNKVTLQFINAILGNTDRILRIDFSDKNNVISVAAALINCKNPIEAKLFKFDQYDEGRRKLLEAAIDTFSTGISLLTTYEDLCFQFHSCQNEIERKKNDIAFHQLEMEKVSSEKFDMDQDIRERNDRVKKYENQIEDMISDIKVLEASILNREKENIDLGDETPEKYTEDSYNAPAAFFGRHTKKLQYRGSIPFVFVNPILGGAGGSFKEGVEGQSRYMYSVEYSSDLGKPADAKIEVYVKKCDMPVNAAKIKINRIEIKATELQIKRLERNMSELKQELADAKALIKELNLSDLIEYKFKLNVFRQEHVDKIQCLNKEIGLLQAQCSEFPKSFEQVRSKIENQRQKYDTVLQVYNAIGSTLDVLEAFKKKYSNYLYGGDEIKEQQDKPLTVRLPNRSITETKEANETFRSPRSQNLAGQFRAVTTGFGKGASSCSRSNIEQQASLPSSSSPASQSFQATTSSSSSSGNTNGGKDKRKRDESDRSPWKKR